MPRPCVRNAGDSHRKGKCKCSAGRCRYRWDCCTVIGKEQLYFSHHQPPNSPSFDSCIATTPTQHITPHHNSHTMPGQRGPVPVPVQQGGRDLTQQVLDLLDSKPDQQPLQTNVDFPDVSQSEIKAALDRLASRSMLTYQTQEEEQVLLTPEGQLIVSEGSHEYKVWRVVHERGQLPLKELPV